MRVWGDGAIASRTKIEIDAPTTKLKPRIKYGLSGKKLAIASIAIASTSINNSINRGGLYWLDKIQVLNQNCQNLIIGNELNFFVSCHLSSLTKFCSPEADAQTLRFVICE
jgi:hypothetical protein